jgi:O-antigen ligase
VESALGNPPGGYEAAKLAGCAVVFLALPRLLQSERRLKFLVAGLVCGGIALAIQIHQHLGESASNSYANFQQLKSAAAFSTWNPNTVGQAAILFAFAAGLGGILFRKSRAGRMFWPSLALGFALLPLAVFVRGSSLSIAAAFLFFFCITRRWKSVLVFTLACTCALVALQYRDRGLMEDASSVNVATGEGFSHRFDRWGMAIEGIRKGPWLGHGFGQEMPYLTLIGSEGRAHNAYLAVWLELGAGGLLLFLALIWQFFSAGWNLFESPTNRAQGGLILALILALCLDSAGLPTLYWEKLPTIALSLAVAVVGICERAGSTAFIEQEEFDDSLAYTPSTQNLQGRRQIS